MGSVRETLPGLCPVPLQFFPYKLRLCQVVFIFHHCGLVLIDVFLNKKHRPPGKSSFRVAHSPSWVTDPERRTGSLASLLHDHLSTACISAHSALRGEPQLPAQEMQTMGRAATALPFLWLVVFPKPKLICSLMVLGGICPFCILSLRGRAVQHPETSPTFPSARIWSLLPQLLAESTLGWK